MCYAVGIKHICEKTVCNGSGGIHFVNGYNMWIDILYNFLEILFFLRDVVVCTRAEIGNYAVIKQVVIHHC